jgi:hypothetical protein
MPAWFQFRRTRLLGARVYVHWSVLVVVALLALVSIRSPIHAAVAVASYLGIIVIHEAGHAWVAHRLGHAVDAIHVSFLHGYCTHDMPYNETDHVLIAWGDGHIAWRVVPLLWNRRTATGLRRRRR